MPISVTKIPNTKTIIIRNTKSIYCLNIAVYTFLFCLFKPNIYYYTPLAILFYIIIKFVSKSSYSLYILRIFRIILYLIPKITYMNHYDIIIAIKWLIPNIRSEEHTSELQSRQ